MYKKFFDLDILILVLLLLLVFMCTYADGKSRITISKMTSHEIVGQVYISNPQLYKIVVFAQQPSETWVKQPYPGDKKGYSWAPLKKDGSWRLDIIERFSQKMNFIAKYCVILVPIDTSVPDRMTTSQFRFFSVVDRNCIRSRR